MKFKALKILLLVCVTIFCLFSCKVDDPFVDREVAPLLVDVVGAAWASPFATLPSVTYDSSSSELVLSVRLLKLDKTGILDHTRGIDSIPVSNVEINLDFGFSKIVKEGEIGGVQFTADTMNVLGTLGKAVSDASGIVSFLVNYDDFGLKGNGVQRAGDIVQLRWSGVYEGQAFTRLSQVNISEE
jgi:hypothetical protein